MIYKYIVTWCLNVAVSMAAEPQKDEFGRNTGSYNASYRYTYHMERGNEREFVSRSEAFEFYGHAKNEQESAYSMTRVCEVKIDSLLIKKQ
jgi:hypothetical protein